MGALSGFFDAQTSALNTVKSATQDRVRKNAGARLASRDYGGAANELYSAGMLDQGSEVQNYGQAQEDRVEDQRAAKAKEGATLMIQVARGLKEVPRGQRKPQLDRFSQVFAKIGIDPAQLGALTEDDLDDAQLEMFAGSVEKELEQYTLSPGSRRYDEKGQLIAEAPFAPQYKEVGEGDTLVQVGGGSAAAPSGQDPLAVIQELTGAGARVTSARRSPGHNARVGGAPNSYHLTDRARDIVPPPGMSMAQLEARLRGSGVEFAELINEGDHIHVAWAGEGGGPGAKVVARGAPKPPKEQSRPATEAEKAVYGIPAHTPAQIKPDGTIDVIALPKGTADIEKDQRAVEAQILKAKDIIGLARSAKADVSGFSAGALGGNISGIKGTPAYNLERSIDTIKANLGFQELQAMRQASPTGGALGAIAVQELNALQSTVASLDTGQSPEQLRRNLDKIERHYQRWIDAVGGKAPQAAKPAAKPASAAKPAPAGLPPQAAAQLKAGHITTFGNGQKWTIRNGKPARVS